jgi:hypothetical protein
MVKPVRPFVSSEPLAVSVAWDHSFWESFQICIFAMGAPWLFWRKQASLFSPVVASEPMEAFRPLVRDAVDSRPDCKP